MNVSQLLKTLQVRVEEGDGDLPVFIGGLPNEGPKVTKAEVFFFDVDKSDDGRKVVFLSTSTNGKDPEARTSR